MKYINKNKSIVELIKDDGGFVTVRFVKSGVDQSIPKNRFKKAFKELEDDKDKA